MSSFSCRLLLSYDVTILLYNSVLVFIFYIYYCLSSFFFLSKKCSCPISFIVGINKTWAYVAFFCRLGLCTFVILQNVLSASQWPSTLFIVFFLLLKVDQLPDRTAKKSFEFFFILFFCCNVMVAVWSSLLYSSCWKWIWWRHDSKHFAMYLSLYQALFFIGTWLSKAISVEIIDWLWTKNDLI